VLTYWTLHHPQFDTLLINSIFGDILSDEASMITGSIGMLPSASVGESVIDMSHSIVCKYSYFCWQCWKKALKDLPFLCRDLVYLNPSMALLLTLLGRLVYSSEHFVVKKPEHSLDTTMSSFVWNFGCLYYLLYAGQGKPISYNS
jgi:hypothetical protein